MILQKVLCHTAFFRLGFWYMLCLDALIAIILRTRDTYNNYKKGYQDQKDLLILNVNGVGPVKRMSVVNTSNKNAINLRLLWLSDWFNFFVILYNRNIIITYTRKYSNFTKLNHVKKTHEPQWTPLIFWHSFSYQLWMKKLIFLQLNSKQHIILDNLWKRHFNVQVLGRRLFWNMWR